MKIIMAIIIHGVLLLNNLNHFNVKKMTQGEYLHVQSHEIENPDKEKITLAINLKEKLSEEFITEYIKGKTRLKEYLASEDEIDTSEIKNYLSRFFVLEIENYENKDYSISHDVGLPIIQEAKDKEGEWKPIEYIESAGNLLYYKVSLPSKSKLEIAAPRYSGNFETELRLKIAIQEYGLLTSKPFKGKINYSQFKKLKTKKLKSRIHFLD